MLPVLVPRQIVGGEYLLDPLEQFVRDEPGMIAVVLDALESHFPDVVLIAEKGVDDGETDFAGDRRRWPITTSMSDADSAEQKQ